MAGTATGRGHRPHTPDSHDFGRNVRPRLNSNGRSAHTSISAPTTTTTTTTTKPAITSYTSSQPEPYAPIDDHTDLLLDILFEVDASNTLYQKSIEKLTAACNASLSGGQALEPLFRHVRAKAATREKAEEITAALESAWAAKVAERLANTVTSHATLVNFILELLECGQNVFGNAFSDDFRHNLLPDLNEWARIHSNTRIPSPEVESHPRPMQTPAHSSSLPDAPSVPPAAPSPDGFERGKPQLPPPVSCPENQSQTAQSENHFDRRGRPSPREIDFEKRDKQEPSVNGLERRGQRESPANGFEKRSQPAPPVNSRDERKEGALMAHPVEERKLVTPVLNHVMSPPSLPSAHEAAPLQNAFEERKHSTSSINLEQRRQADAFLEGIQPNASANGFAGREHHFPTNASPPRAPMRDRVANFVTVPYTDTPIKVEASSPKNHLSLADRIAPPPSDSRPFHENAPITEHGFNISRAVFVGLRLGANPRAQETSLREGICQLLGNPDAVRFCKPKGGYWAVELASDRLTDSAIGRRVRIGVRNVPIDKYRLKGEQRFRLFYANIPVSYAAELEAKAAQAIAWTFREQNLTFSLQSQNDARTRDKRWLLCFNSPPSMHDVRFFSVEVDLNVGGYREPFLVHFEPVRPSDQCLVCHGHQHTPTLCKFVDHVVLPTGIVVPQYSMTVPQYTA